MREEYQTEKEEHWQREFWEWKDPYYDHPKNPYKKMLSDEEIYSKLNQIKEDYKKLSGGDINE